MSSTVNDREQFYTEGCDGSTLLEATALIMCLPLLCVAGELFKAGARGKLKSSAQQCVADARRGPVWALAAEYAVALLPLVLLTMGSLLPPIETCLSLLGAALALAAFSLSRTVEAGLGSERRARLLETWDNIAAQRGCRYTGAFRGLLMLGTCICILAVDFRAFPRRYAKTHVWGFSLMDVGVGGIVLATGLVTKPPPATSGSSWSARVVQGIRSAAPCWVLWGARLCAVQALDYQEQVGEYGVHWNFFATVAIITAAHHAVASSHGWRGQALTAVAVCTLHQTALSCGLGPWSRSPERSQDLLSLNKEGITSLGGFLTLSLAGSAIGQWLRESLHPACRRCAKLLIGSDNPPSGALRRWQVLWPILSGPVAALALVTVALWVLVGLLAGGVEPSCRRCANATYVLWVCATSLLVLLTLLVAQLLLPGGLQPHLLQAASQNMLPLFLVANLMTGAVNLSIDTLQVPNHLACALVSVYLGILCALLGVLQNRRVKLRI